MFEAATIVVHDLDGWWHATHEGDGSGEIEDLFGTVTLPTPWSTEVPVAKVIDTLLQLNPRSTVVYRKGTVEITVHPGEGTRQ